jgi:hypothetical protein
MYKRLLHIHIWISLIFILGHSLTPHRHHQDKGPGFYAIVTHSDSGLISFLQNIFCHNVAESHFEEYGKYNQKILPDVSLETSNFHEIIPAFLVSTEMAVQIADQLCISEPPYYKSQFKIEASPNRGPPCMSGEILSNC